MHRSMHGYDLYRQYQDRLGRVWKMSQSQMYSILKRLETKGLVRRLIEEDQSEPSRRYLEVTEDGIRRFSTWLLHPTDCSSRTLRLEFVARLFFACMQGTELLGMIIDDQAATIARQIDNHIRILHDLAADDTFNRLSMEFRIRQLRAASEWLRDAVLPLSGVQAPFPAPGLPRVESED